MNTQATGFFATLHRPRPMMCGVCAALADTSGLPLWMIRVAALLLLLSHVMLVGVAYLIAAACLRRGRSRAGAGRDGLTDRFSRLERRLAQVEEEAVSGEWTLRRRFRDLGQ